MNLVQEIRYFRHVLGNDVRICRTHTMVSWSVDKFLEHASERCRTAWIWRKSIYFFVTDSMPILRVFKQFANVYVQRLGKTHQHQ